MKTKTFEAKRKMAIDLKSVQKNAVQVAEDKENAKVMQSSNKAKAQESFNAIYKRYKSPIFYMALKYVKMNKETADDLVQEIFVKVFEKIKSYDFSTAFSTWMYNVAKNHLIDHKRKQKIEVLSVETLGSIYSGDEDVSEVAFQVEDKSADIFNSMVKSERAKMISDAINKGIKSEDGKQVISLIFMDEMSYEEVSQTMKMPLGTVKAVMFRAKTEMKAFIDKKSKEFQYGRICQTKLKTLAEVA